MGHAVFAGESAPVTISTVFEFEKSNGESRAASNSSKSSGSKRSPPPHTVFTRWQCRYLAWLCGVLTLASTLTANIYLPLIPDLAAQYSTSTQGIYLTITVYSIMQLIAPSIFSPVSDTFGRRPVFFITFIIFTIASLGLAFSGTSYTSLLVLRAIQSFGGSAVTPLAFSVASDITSSADRGRVIGPIQALNNFGPCFGPVIGGVVVWATGESRWCFVALTVFGDLAILFIGFTLPETCRNVVGNGAVPAQGIWRTWWSFFAGTSLARALSKDRDAGQLESQDSFAIFDADETLRAEIVAEDGLPESNDGTINRGKIGKGRFTWPHPWHSLGLLSQIRTFLILWLSGSTYALWSIIQASMTITYGTNPDGSGYGFSPLLVGVFFLPGGVGVILASLLAGGLMDRSWTHVSSVRGIPKHHPSFPIEDARTRFSYLYITGFSGLVAAYGFAFHYKIHPAATLVMQALIGAFQIMTYQMYMTLMIDIFPEYTGRAGASNNIVKCAISAGMVAALPTMTKFMGLQWYFACLGLGHGVSCVAAVFFLRRLGEKRRQDHVHEA